MKEIFLLHNCLYSRVSYLYYNYKSWFCPAPSSIISLSSWKSVHRSAKSDHTYFKHFYCLVCKKCWIMWSFFPLLLPGTWFGTWNCNWTSNDRTFIFDICIFVIWIIWFNCYLSAKWERCFRIANKNYKKNIICSSLKI